MSGFGSGQFADDEVAQLQEELRRRQFGAGNAAAINALAARAARQQPGYGDPHMMLGAADAAAAVQASPYYQRPPGAGVHPHQHSPYQRVAANPYYQDRGAYPGRSPNATDGSLAALYANHRNRQQQQQQHLQQQVFNAAYPPSAASALDQHYAAVYAATAPPQASPQYPPRDPQGAYPQPTAAASSAQDLILQQHQQMAAQYNRDRALMQQQQQQQQQNNSTPSAAQASPAAGYGTTPKSPPKASSSQKTPNRSPKAPKVSSEKTPKEPSSASQSMAVPQRTMSKDGRTILEEGQAKWFTGCVPLGLDDDKYWLSELQVYLRSHFAEAFGATEDDIAAPMHGRNKPIALGQVGIRCMHCKNDNPAERGQQATSYPSLISGIYNSVQQMLRLHLDCCLTMPHDVRMKIEQLKVSCSSRGGRKQYWIDSAKRLGLVDTPHGIHFGRDPTGPLPPLSGPSVNSKEGRKKKAPPKSASSNAGDNGGDVRVDPPLPKPAPPPVDARPLVFQDDKPLISDYLYLTLEQMAPCVLMEADRVGCYKTRKVGFPGLACKHCVGQAGCGRYFPASEASLSQTTTSQTIMNHVRNCRRCPIEIRENLEIMKRNRMGPDGKRADKPKHGGRKVFFHRLWCRIQGVPFEEGKGEPKEIKKKKLKKPGPKKKKKSEEDDDMDRDSDDDDDDDDVPATALTSGDESDSDEDSEATEEESPDPKTRGKRKQTSSSSSPPTQVSTPTPSKKKPVAPWFEGCVRLTKTDDPHWLSEMECFARSDLVEVFTLDKNDSLDGYGGRKEPAVGQVGIRCIFCKDAEPSERPNGYVSFPDALSSIHAKVADMIRLHFPSCPCLPEDARDTFKSLRGFDAKVASDDSAQYWIDAARDIGLSHLPPAGPRVAGAWGTTFRRDPLQPSPADEIDLEASNGSTVAQSPNSLVRPDDRGLCTDQVMLLLRQVRPCRFKKSDRRAGPGSRGRDRAMGFPGLSCMHCVGRNTLGRYFPVSAKNLTDSTANSLQAHISSCAYCPEPIKASLAYLGHRSILQKAELSGSWKKAFFKKIWDRLHIERGWTSIDDEEEPLGLGSSHATTSPEYQREAEDTKAEAVEQDDADASKDDEGADDDENSDKEELGDHMNALIKAAAIWLTEQDAATDTAKAAARASKGRSLPAKRPALPSSKSRAANLPTKRRRVHF